MGHHLFRRPKHRRYRDMGGYYEGDDHSGYRERRALPVLNIPTSVIVAGLVIWSAVRNAQIILWHSSSGRAKDL